MSLMYLNFASNLNKQQSTKDNYFVDMSLAEQYEKLKFKYGINTDSFEDLINSYFTEGHMKEYYISYPGFDRTAEIEEKKGRTYKKYKNIVIRSSNDEGSLGYDMVIFGDISCCIFGKENKKDLFVKGIELIDTNISKYGEKRVYAKAVCAFSKNGNFPKYPHQDGNELLDEEMLDDILENFTPVPNYSEAINIYEQWRDYITFRYDVLNKQSMETWEVSDVKYIATYKIDKSDYKKTWSSLRINQRVVTEPVILSEKVEGAKSAPLICVSIDDTSDKLYKDLKKRTNPYNYPMKLIFNDSMEKYTKVEEMLGERYHICDEIIKPDFSDIEKKFQKKRSDKIQEINRQYDIRIERDLEEEIQRERTRLKEVLIDEISLEEIDYDINILDSLDIDIKKELQSKLSSFDSKINNIKASYKVRKRNRNGSEAEQQRKLERAVAEIEHQKKDAIKNICKKYDIDPRESIIEKKLEQELNIFKTEKKRKLEVLHENEKNIAIQGVLDQINLEEETEKKNRLKEKTIYRTKIYFMAESFHGLIKKDIEKKTERYDTIELAHNDIRERTKLNRQKNALENFFGGVLKNPFIPLQMLSPKSISTQNVIDDKEPEWFLPSLNAKQRSAVKLALRSDGIFLLQGPPGTGKTQVIAELTAQLVKAGKKVAISSETNKAIDNVFERLPQRPEIRPFRLSKSGNYSDYRPEMLVNNFYDNISSTLKKRSLQLQDPEAHILLFKEKMQSLAKTYFEYTTLKNELKSVEEEKESIENENKRIKATIAEYEDNIQYCKNRQDRYKRAIQYIEQCNFTGDVDCSDLLVNFESALRDLLLSDLMFGQTDISNISYLYTCDLEEIRKDLSAINANAQLATLRQINIDAKIQKQKITDELTEEAIQGHEEEWELLSIKIRNSGNQIRSLQNTTTDISGVKLVQVVGESTLMAQGVVTRFIDELMLFRNKIKDVIHQSISQIDKMIDEVEKEVTLIKNKINELQAKHAKNQDKIIQLKENDDYSDFSNAQTLLRNLIAEMVRDFASSKEYSDIDDGMFIIKDEWRRAERERSKILQEAKIRLPMYKKICDYLNDDGIRTEDKERYMTMLYERVNVYGFTSSSGKDGYSDLSHFGIDDINVQKAGIDVVIIDEVSKSSFIDLLVPILYGKSVVLVGDHRQLPPMYDLRHMDKADFEEIGFDNSETKCEDNHRFTEMYEASYFKQLFEQVPDSRRESLLKQYRCHSHIMDIFNHFYGGSFAGLQKGTEDQDEHKSHRLSVTLNGKNIIKPEKHIYFVDCEGEESGELDSTSLKNEQEAQVVVKLLETMNDEYGHMLNSGSMKDSERLSAGVICTYGLQTGEIKRMCKGKKLNNFSDSKDERLMFDTVDNFQGDERDIIIVSMVRNPPEGKRMHSDFIKQFERINVALSRARCLLIIVGNQDTLSKKCKINLPDMYGNHSNDKKDYPVYMDIIKTVEQKGIMLTASDVLGGNNETD